jgi:3-hydroxyisobutyrate dehydrogenase-like beta-hydroxyacid dehydrogenase
VVITPTLSFQERNDEGRAPAIVGEAVITMLADDNAAESVVFDDAGVVSILRKGAIHISSSTISVALSEKMTAAHAANGQRFVSAPVFGRPDTAAAGRLFVAVAGAPDAVDDSMPLLEAIGQKTFRFGNNPSDATLVKLSGNFLISSVIEALGEAMALVGKAGHPANVGKCKCSRMSSCEPSTRKLAPWRLWERM